MLFNVAAFIFVFLCMRVLINLLFSKTSKKFASIILIVGMLFVLMGVYVFAQMDFIQIAGYDKSLNFYIMFYIIFCTANYQVFFKYRFKIDSRISPNIAAINISLLILISVMLTLGLGYIMPSIVIPAYSFQKKIIIMIVACYVVGILFLETTEFTNFIIRRHNLIVKADEKNNEITK